LRCHSLIAPKSGKQRRFVLTFVRRTFTLNANDFLAGRCSMIRCPLLVAVVVSLAICSLAEAWQTAEARTNAKTGSQTVTITEQDNGKDIDLTSGGTLVLKLKSNPSTGYSWAVAGDPAPLKLQKTSFHKNTASEKVVGAPGVQVFRFTAGSAGIATLNLNYRRSWEYTVPPARTFSVRVNVR
jgi:inhibitor of cysteine peptidase